MVTSAPLRLRAQVPGSKDKVRVGDLERSLTVFAAP